jgi:hypothetical protein
MRVTLSMLSLLAAPLAAQQPVASLLAEYDRMANRPLWAGFTPATTPLAIYDGQRTWLIRHPHPPAEFAPSGKLTGASVMTGQYAEVRANTHTEIGGLPTATLLWPDKGIDPARLAATMIHEAFHVFQAKAHPGWFGNEATLFTYPVTDSAAQRLQRLETEAFRRALLPRAPLACWASRALALRSERARLIGTEAIAYERGNDLNEGLATWIEWRAGDRPIDSLIRSSGFAPDGVRLRAYAVGPAQAFLLDRLHPGWPAELSADTTLTLDSLLARATAPISCRADFTRREVDSVSMLAGQETAQVLGRRAELREEFLARQGWQLVIEVSGKAPLWPEQFDPWNVVPLANGEILHQRHLRLGGDHGRIDLLDHWAITSAAGAHPLFNGIRRVLVAGLATAPVLTSRGDSVFVSGNGLDGRFTGMAVDTAAQRITLRSK